MAWPPPALPTNRTNAMPQQDTHPADHNAQALAINDTVGQVAGLLTAVKVPFCRATLAASALPGSGVTGWGVTAEVNDPTGTLTVLASGIQVTKGGICAVTLVPTTAPASAKFGMTIRVNDPLAGAIVAAGSTNSNTSDVDSASGLAWLPSGGSLHPSFFGTPSAGVGAGYFMVAYLGAIG